MTKDPLTSRIISIVLLVTFATCITHQCGYWSAAAHAHNIRTTAFLPTGTIPRSMLSTKRKRTVLMRTTALMEKKDINQKDHDDKHLTCNENPFNHYYKNDTKNKKHTDATRISLSTPRTARVTLPLTTIMSNIFFTWTATPSVSHGATSTSLFDSSLKEFFPGSIPSSTVLLRVQSTLRKRQYLPYNTILASSLPTEEILYTPTSLIRILGNKLCESKNGGIYSLGGLGGIPFAGDAGMEDLFLHAPQEDGRIVILFGPNVGIDKDGVLGRVERIGVALTSASASVNPVGGAAVAGAAEECNGVVMRALKDVLGAANGLGRDSRNNSKTQEMATTQTWTSGLNWEYNYIRETIQKMPLDEWWNGKAGGNPNYVIAQVTMQFYNLMEDLMSQMVQRCIRDHVNTQLTEVTLMGGIVINRGHGSGTEGGDDYFQPLYMKSWDMKGTEVNLYPQVFGDLSTPRN